MQASLVDPLRRLPRNRCSVAPLLSRGGVAARQRKSCEATLARADGVVLIRIMIFLTSTTPAAATASAFPSSAEEGELRFARWATAPYALGYRMTPLRG